MSLTGVDPRRGQSATQVQALIDTAVAAIPRTTPKWVSGDWHDTRDLVGGTAANASLVNGTIYAVPLLVPDACTLDRIGINVAVVGAAGKIARLMLYSPLANGLPGALLLDAGTVVVDALGDQTITIAQAVPAGILYTAIISDGTPQIQGLGTTFRGITGTATPTPGGLRGSATNAVGGSSAPNPYPTSLTYSSALVRIAVRMA